MLFRSQANGAAENAVKTIKKAIKRAQYENEDVNATLSKFLFKYRNCPHATTGVSPCVALQGRRLRSRLDALRPDVGAVVRAAQERQVRHGPSAARDFEVGDEVLARDYSVRGEKWAVGIVSKKTGPVSYNVDVGNGTQWRRHADQIASVAPAGNKNRYSLSRASTGGQEVESYVSSSRVDSDTQIPKESAAGVTVDSEPPEQASCARAVTVSNRPPQGGQEAAVEVTQASPPSNASARALHAFNSTKLTL